MIQSAMFTMMGHIMFYNSPLYSPEYNLEVAIGAIKFRDLVIENLRNQIKQLRSIVDPSLTDEQVHAIQHKFQK